MAAVAAEATESDRGADDGGGGRRWGRNPCQAVLHGESLLQRGARVGHKSSRLSADFVVSPPRPPSVHRPPPLEAE